jgi:hypothetical protein
VALANENTSAKVHHSFRFLHRPIEICVRYYDHRHITGNWAIVHSLAYPVASLPPLITVHDWLILFTYLPLVSLVSPCPRQTTVVPQFRTRGHIHPVAPLLAFHLLPLYSFLAVVDLDLVLSATSWVRPGTP